MNLKGLEIIIRLSVEDFGHGTKDLQYYKQYINHLKNQQHKEKQLGISKKSQPYRDFEGYQDHLQHPLQPLYDNLESTTYEVFERDPIKYNLYEQAMAEAIKDTLRKQNRSKTDLFTIVVAGAGRGPLVQKAIHAANINHLENCQIIVIEKNPAAFLTLQQRKQAVWDRHVCRKESIQPYSSDPQKLKNLTENMILWQKNRIMPKIVLLESDMRDAIAKFLKIAPGRSDLLVSELLGSFGCNEVSPECLDPAQLMLKPETGICIPQSYSSWLVPVSSQKLYNELKATGSRSQALDAQYESSFVVHMKNFTSLCQPKLAWEFIHPNPQVYQDAVEIYDKAGNLTDIHLPWKNRNEKFTSVKFKSQHSNIPIHGFNGYFESVLYKNITMNTNPSTHTPAMFSWFPIYFPLRPEHVVTDCRKEDEIEICMWRKANKSSVWYEYCLVKPRPSGRAGLKRF